MTRPLCWAVAVVVPACDEAERIRSSLRAVAVSVRRAIDQRRTRRHRTLIVVVANGCRDDTAALARQTLSATGLPYRLLDLDRANVGRARRRGCEAALAALDERWPRRQLWLAHTDADTRVPCDWLLRHFDEADAGAAAVAGVVRLDACRRHAGVDGRYARFAAVYATSDDGTHPHVHGANLGTRADVYCAVGGWRSRPLAEDHCLWQRVRAHYPVAATTRSWVATSARLSGRAEGGFADTLRALAGPAAARESGRVPA